MLIIPLGFVSFRGFLSLVREDSGAGKLHATCYSKSGRRAAEGVGCCLVHDCSVRLPACMFARVSMQQQTQSKHEELDSIPMI